MKNLVIIGTVFPEPNSTAAGTRMLQLIDLFLEMDFKIKFLSAASLSEFSHPFDDDDVEYLPIKLNDDSFDNLLKEISPEIVVYDRYISEEQFGWRVAKSCPEAMTILETVDLHFLRKARENSIKKNGNLEHVEFITDVFKREMASIFRCDLSLIISDYEMTLLTEKFKLDASILHYIPMFVSEINKSTIPFSERRDFVSIGNFLHEPNWQTVLQLKKIWPSIKSKIPEAKLNIYGAYLPEKAKQLHNEKEGFLIKGRANSVQEIFEKSRILLAPIPFGAGIKGKLLDSMMYGLPNVTSEIGAEGMHGTLPWNGEITDDFQQFGVAAIDLYKNENRWNIAQENGYKLLENRFQKVEFAASFKEKIEEISKNLKPHRDRNFLGQIFQHQSLQSTKYMSLWITEKNKN
ncbi:glycosyltransferase involved in cell wall biosynthesis [Chryseobacterium sp. 16F]|uniref:Glycosyltransferase involved in cell wall biosynthesis n=1 Tax=Frigoriflavimonas asaccharolytica TaxID=2735899 RepID=A0A8J8GD19_9FLAO|nr:glycosyltransferase involved in cell wall biosynthesis [Frigoriflavimonas asaccharolytica]